MSGVTLCDRPMSVSKRRRSIMYLPSYPSHPKFEPRPTNRRQESRCRTEGMEPSTSKVIITQARLRFDRALTPRYGGRPVGKVLRVVKLASGDSDPPPNAFLFLGPFLCQSYQILSTICIAHVSKARGGCGRATNRMVHEEHGIIRRPFRS